MSAWMKLVANEKTKRIDYFCKAGHTVKREDETCPTCQEKEQSK